MEYGPNLTPEDASVRIRMLQTQVEALEVLCEALIATHPDTSALVDRWDRLRTTRDVQSVELDLMAMGLGTDPTPEEGEMKRQAFHWLDRMIRRAVKGP